MSNCDLCGVASPPLAPLVAPRFSVGGGVGGSWQLSDGRIYCAACHATAVTRPAEAAALYSDMTKSAAQFLGLTLNVPTGLALVDRNQLAEVIQTVVKVPGLHPHPASALDPQRTLGIYARQGIRRGIYVQTGLPRRLFLQVAAHEFAHAWQAENCPTLSDAVIREGFAEWIAYRLWRETGGLSTNGVRAPVRVHEWGGEVARELEVMLSRDDLYGQGLRWALDMEKQAGVQGVILACRRAVG